MLSIIDSYIQASILALEKSSAETGGVDKNNESDAKASEPFPLTVYKESTNNVVQAPLHYRSWLQTCGATIHFK